MGRHSGTKGIKLPGSVLTHTTQLIYNSMKKSKTQMTKAELMVLLNEKDVQIAELHSRIDELESMAITSQAVPMDADSSRLLSMMNQRIRALEEKLRDQ